MTTEQLKEKVSQLSDREVSDEMLIHLSNLSRKQDVTNIRLAWIIALILIPWAVAIVYLALTL